MICAHSKLYQSPEGNKEKEGGGGSNIAMNDEFLKPSEEVFDAL